MTLMQVEKLEKAYGGDVLFAPFSTHITRGDRIALVGDNGTGKSTLLRLLAGKETPTRGRIEPTQDLRVAFLPQVARLKGRVALYEAMCAPFSELIETEAKLRRLEECIAETPDDQEALHRYDTLLHAFRQCGGYTIDATIRSVLRGVGFSMDMFDVAVARLSGGETARAALAQVLLERADLLLLDEPTNHLDFAALDWLEETLLDFPGALVLVSHDRHLLNRITTRTWEIAFGEVITYDVGYAASRELREAERTRRAKHYARQQETIERYKSFIRRHHAGQKHRQAKDREKKLARLEAERVPAPQEARRITLNIEQGRPSGRRILAFERLAVGFREPLFTCPDHVLLRGERVAIIGPNGCGKTTLLKTIAGDVAPLSGAVALGQTVRPAIYSQTQEGLHDEGTVLDAILARSDLSIPEARGLLGRFLFGGDDVEKTMNTLSGGERSRVALALLSLMAGNLLLLDEPTNHLDLESQEILQKALLAYPGTILLVSHDRALLEAVATQVWEICEGRLHVHTCDFNRYRERRAAQTGLRSADSAIERAPRGRPRAVEQKRDRYQERRRQEEIHGLESEIERVETEIKTIERELHEASARGDGKAITELGQQHGRLTQDLKELYGRWEMLGEA
jgi:ATP-binding cassette subfamily F protein 3